MDISVIIPVYNGKNIINSLFAKIKKILEPNYEFEVLLIEDSGNNANIKEITALVNEYPKFVKAFNLKLNYGQHRALLFGCGHASGEFIITMDDDFQHDPEDILKLITKQIEGNYDVVYGKFIDTKYSLIRKKTSRIFRHIIKTLLPSLYFNYSPYRLIRKTIVNDTLKIITPYVFIDDYLSRITNSFSSVDIQHYKRPSGESSVTIPKLIWNGILILLAYSRIIMWLFAMSCFLIFAGSLIYFENTTDHFNKFIKSNNLTLAFTIIAFGLLLAFICFLGIIIKYHQTKRNTKPVLFDEIKSI